MVLSVAQELNELDVGPEARLVLALIITGQGKMEKEKCIAQHTRQRKDSWISGPMHLLACIIRYTKSKWPRFVLHPSTLPEDPLCHPSLWVLIVRLESWNQPPSFLFEQFHLHHSSRLVNRTRTSFLGLPAPAPTFLPG